VIEECEDDETENDALDHDVRYRDHPVRLRSLTLERVAGIHYFFYLDAQVVNAFVDIFLSRRI
jgi:hypothetical protein